MDLEEKLERRIDQHNEIVIRQRALREEYAELELERQTLTGGIATLNELISETKGDDAPKTNQPVE